MQFWILLVVGLILVVLILLCIEVVSSFHQQNRAFDRLLREEISPRLVEFDRLMAIVDSWQKCFFDDVEEAKSREKWREEHGEYPP